MEESIVKKKLFTTTAKPMSEMLPELKAIMSKDAMVTLTAKKQPRPTMAQSSTSAKSIKPLTFAEMRAELQVLTRQSPRRAAQSGKPSAKKGWNSSVKVDKKISHTADGKLQSSTVRKVLNFQSKPKAATRMTIQKMETPKIPKPELRSKKSLHLQAKDNIQSRISGICNIPQTPVETVRPIKSRMTIANKENNPYQAKLSKKILAPPVPNFKQFVTPSTTNIKKFVTPTIVKTNMKKMATPKLDTPLNSSWKSGSDASFLQKEKEINEIEEKIKAIAEEPTLEKISEVSPPVSTPFKEYRSVQEYFNNSSQIENCSLYNDNTIMCFDKPSICNENEKREESVIVSLCDLFNKATVTTEKANTEHNNLLETEKQMEKNIKNIEIGIQTLKKIKELEIKNLKNVQMLIEEKRNLIKSESDQDKTLVAVTKETNMIASPEKSPILSRPCSVIKSSRSPGYKIPKKNTCLRKKLVCKSMPNVSSAVTTPVKDFEGRALNMYMKMKEQMNFLSTPMVNRMVEVPDTPVVTSHNLQKQLDKLFGS